MDEYLKAVDLLTIHNNSTKLEKQVKELSEQNKNNEYIILGKLQQKEVEMKNIKLELESIKKQLNSFFVELANTKDQKQVNKTAKLLFDSGIIEGYSK